VLEHITTEDAVKFVLATDDKVAATITPQHLLLNRNSIFTGGIRPHFYCLPILKREIHRQALLTAATSGNPKFFLGTDSAPHPRNSKENDCGCAGCYSAFHALELYAEAFEQVQALDKLEAFASFHGPDFYRLPRNLGKTTLIQECWRIPEEIPFLDSGLVPLNSGAELRWRRVDSEIDSKN
jgi:dihydroorotase